VPRQILVERRVTDAQAPSTLSSICITPISGRSSGATITVRSTPARPRRPTSRASSFTAPKASARFRSSPYRGRQRAPRDSGAMAAVRAMEDL